MSNKLGPGEVIYECSNCEGTGNLSYDEKEKEYPECQECGGTGQIISKGTDDANPKIDCLLCDGTGNVVAEIINNVKRYETCYKCSGVGVIDKPKPRESTHVCPNCEGIGTVNDHEGSLCFDCQGTGQIISKGTDDANPKFEEINYVHVVPGREKTMKEIEVSRENITVKELLKAKEDFEIELWEYIRDKIQTFKVINGIQINGIWISLFSEKDEINWRCDDVKIDLELGISE